MDAERENEDTEQVSVEKVSVRDAIATAVDHIRSVCFKRNIGIETDLDGVDVEADSTLIVPAIASLLTNGINAMPVGGELSVTLVDTDSQWELEVADSGRSPSRFNVSQSPSDQIPEHPPVFIEFLSHQALHEVGLLAEEYSGSMETYPCPLGGSAHVLIIPKFAGQNQVNSVAQNKSRRAA